MAHDLTHWPQTDGAPRVPVRFLRVWQDEAGALYNVGERAQLRPVVAARLAAAGRVVVEAAADERETAGKALMQPPAHKQVRRAPATKRAHLPR